MSFISKTIGIEQFQAIFDHLILKIFGVLPLKNVKFLNFAHRVILSKFEPMQKGMKLK